MTTTAPDTKAVATKRKTLPELLADESTRQRFVDMLGKDARSFQQNILTVYNGSEGLQKCDPESIIAACAISASINLSILPSLGQSCVVPYKDGDRLVAQWQIQWKGLIQLAHRSQQYRRINLALVYEGELIAYDKFKGIVKLDETKKKSGRIQGYYFYFELITGGVFEFYWSAKECVEHGLRYSKSFQKGLGKWTEDPAFENAGSVKKWLDGKEHFLTEGSGADAMSAKTIVKNEVQTWGPLETRIKEIVATDQAVIDGSGKVKYIDTTAEPTPEAKTYTAPPAGEKGHTPSAIEKIAWAREAAKKQGVANEMFDAWIARQPGDETAKAEAVTAAWKKVTSKEAKATEVFAVVEEKVVTFQVASVATADYEGEPCSVIRDTGDSPTKYYTDVQEVIEAARACKESETDLPVRYVEKKSGKTTIRWAIGLA